MVKGSWLMVKDERKMVTSLKKKQRNVCFSLGKVYLCSEKSFKKV